MYNKGPTCFNIAYLFLEVSFTMITVLYLYTLHKDKQSFSLKNLIK